MITTIEEFMMYSNLEFCFDTKNKLNEGLIKTYNPDKVYTSLKKYLRFYNNSILIEKDEIINSPLKESYSSELIFPMIITINNYISLTEILNLEQRINTCGYYITSIILDDVYYNTTKDFISFIETKIFDTIDILIDAKFDVSIDTKKLKDNYIYHVTNLKYKDKILKNGLIPRSKYKLSYHLDRVYFDTSSYQINNLAKQLYPELNTNELLFLKVNTNELNINFYQDPYYPSGIYTFENINPKYLEIIK